MTEDDFDESDDGPIALSVDQYFDLEGLDEEYFEVTVEVRNQLANLLLDSAGTPERQRNEAVFRAIMTAVVNLELQLVNAKAQTMGVKSYAIAGITQVEQLRQITMEVYSRLLNLETRICEAGLILDDPGHEPMDWSIEDENEDQ